jgi:uncharacterized protein (TIRG00374 family)
MTRLPDASNRGRPDAADEAAASSRRRALGLARIAITLCLLWWLSRTSGGAQLLEAMKGWRWGWAAVSLVLLALVRVVTAYKWQLLLRAQSVHYRFAPLLSSVWISNFFGQFLPTTAGADGVRLYTFSRASGRPIEAASSLAMERFTGAVAIALLATAGAAWTWVRWHRAEILHVVAAPVVAVVLLTLGMWWAPFQRRTRVWVGRARWLPGRRLIGKMCRAMRVYRHNGGAIVTALVLSVVLHLLRTLAVFCTAETLNLAVTVEQTLAVVPAVLLVAMLPISVGSWGIQEGSFVFLLRFVGLPAASALGLALVWRAIGLAADLPGLGMFWAAGFESRRSDAAPSPAPVRGRPIPEPVKPR